MKPRSILVSSCSMPPKKKKINPRPQNSPPKKSEATHLSVLLRDVWLPREFRLATLFCAPRCIASALLFARVSRCSIQPARGGSSGYGLAPKGFVERAVHVLCLMSRQVYFLTAVGGRAFCVARAFSSACGMWSGKLTQSFCRACRSSSDACRT